MLLAHVTAMHIMEGFLSPFWCLFWAALSFPFIIWGIYRISSRVRSNPRLLMLLALSGAYAFVLSALKIPSITGSSSHPTGTGLTAILFGPGAAAVLGLGVLLFQAFLLAHGGLTTLGANTFSMAVVGPLLSFGLFRLVSGSGRSSRQPIVAAKQPVPDNRKPSLRQDIAVFAAATLGDLATYVMTSLQLAMAYPAAQGGIASSLLRFSSIFALTQIPIALIEGILTVILFRYIYAFNHSELVELKVIRISS